MLMNAVWTLTYDIAAADREAYLAWFHDVHIPEKLARPGYRFAAHFEGPASTGDEQDGLSGFIALFGGDSTRVFLDPSPKQLRPRQDALTREMMGKRRNAMNLVLAHEWSERGPAGAHATDDAIQPPSIGLIFADGAGADEDIGCWCVQELLPALNAQSSSQRVSKFASVTNAPRHVLAVEVDGAASESAVALPDGELGQSVASQASMHVRFGTRIWPATSA